MRSACLLLSCAAALAAQGRPPLRAVLPKDAITVDPAGHDPTRIVLKLPEDTPDPARTRPVADPALRRVIGARPVQPMFSGLERELAEIRARVLAVTPPGEQPPADLALYHEVRAAGLADALELVRALNALPQVELAYPREQPAAPPGDIPPTTPSFVAGQAYRDPAPDGIDSLAIQQLVGGLGRGVTVLEIEWGWWFDHEDLSVLRPGSLVGPPVHDNTYNWHGLGVIGELAADADAFGVSGLTPDIELRVATSYPASGYSVAAAIVAGLPRLRAGDVMLIAAQTTSPLGLVPTEWNQADFDAIQNATQLGVITVETGANGGVDLDDRRLQRAFDLTFRDSGAIIVGATVGRARERVYFSSYGSRIDANGWGLDVVTTGYGDLFAPGGDRRQTYTAAFAGTSSASPMVAAAVVALLGAAKAQLAPELVPAIDYRAIRAILRAHGTSMQPPNQEIGLRPDMRRALRAANLERGLRLRDRAELGQPVTVELSPPGAQAGEAWLLLGAQAPANLPLAPPFTTPYCDRLLLDPATVRPLGEGVFGTDPVLMRLPIPADAVLRGQRYYLQAVTIRTSGAACATNSSLLLIEP